VLFKGEKRTVTVRYESGLEEEHPENSVTFHQGFVVIDDGDEIIVWPARKIHSVRMNKNATS
jgi:hypothetical protein